MDAATAGRCGPPAAEAINPRHRKGGAAMAWLTGHWNDTWMVAAKAALLYATALAGLRFGTRRTLAQMSPFDFIAAVAMGAIIGRTSTSSTTSYATGAVAVVTMITVHRLVSLLRYQPAIRRLTDHRIRVLAADGHIRRHQLWICGLTEDDLHAALRQQGLSRLGQARLVLYERAGAITVVPSHHGGDLIKAALEQAAGPPPAPQAGQHPVERP
jgi:uncharacterized membrane protein YcaP (DUF421 family)